jgi:hypothetical protein
MLTSPEILVPIDFSSCSVNALRVAMAMAAPEGDLTLLHVIDEEFVESAVVAGLGSTEDLRQRLKEQAEANFTAMLEGLDSGNVNMEKMIVVGLPFVEILKICARSRSADDRDGNTGPVNSR